MPKKTKKQKILAQLHRKLQMASKLQTASLKLNSDLVKGQNYKPTSIQQPIYSVSGNNRLQPFPKPKTEILASSYGYVKKDLLKITIFTIFAAALQGVIYFLLRTR